MRKLAVSLGVCLITIVVLATSTFYLYDLNIRQENQTKNLSGQIDILQNKKNSLVVENEDLEDDINALEKVNILLQNEMGNIEDNILSLESQLNELEDEIADLESRVDYAYDEGYDVGYIQGINDGAGVGYNIRDPTYQEMLDFIALDQTDKNEYDEDNYYCYHFTADVKSNAFEAGYKSGFVRITFEFGVHAIISFDTTNQGLIFIEPQTDEIVDVVIGELYECIDFWVGTVQSYTIIW